MGKAANLRIVTRGREIRRRGVHRARQGLQHVGPKCVLERPACRYALSRA